MFLGTPHYAAPEIIEPQLCWPVDGRVDMFATGVVMYHCLTGTLPFAGLSHLDVLYKTVHERPPTPRERAPLRDIPPEVDALVMRAMAVHPDDRFADMAALARAIRETLAPRPASASSPTSASSLADAVARAQATADSLASAVARIRANASQSGRAVDPAGSAAHASLPTPAHDATPAPASPLPDPATLSERGAAIQDPEPRGFGGLIVTVGLMLLGLLALLLLLQQEIGRSRADPRPPREPPPASSPRPTATGPWARPGVPPLPQEPVPSLLLDAPVTTTSMLAERSVSELRQPVTRTSRRDRVQVMGPRNSKCGERWSRTGPPRGWST